MSRHVAHVASGTRAQRRFISSSVTDGLIRLAFEVESLEGWHAVMLSLGERRSSESFDA